MIYDITYTFWSCIANVDFCELQGKNLLDPVGAEDYCKNIFVPFFESAKKLLESLPKKKWASVSYHWTYNQVSYWNLSCPKVWDKGLIFLVQTIHSKNFKASYLTKGCSATISFIRKVPGYRWSPTNTPRANTSYTRSIQTKVTCSIIYYYTMRKIKDW